MPGHRFLSRFNQYIDNLEREKTEILPIRVGQSSTPIVGQIWTPVYNPGRVRKFECRRDRLVSVQSENDFGHPGVAGRSPIMTNRNRGTFDMQPTLWITFVFSTYTSKN